MVCLSPNLILVIACVAQARPHRAHDHNKAPGGGGGGRRRGWGGGYGTPTSHCVAGCLTTRDLFVAVITCKKYHDTRCQRIKRGYGAMLPVGHLAFYSDADDPSLPAYKIIEPAPRGVNERSWGIRKFIPAIADAYRRSSVSFARCRYARSGACMPDNAPDARLCVCNSRCSARDGRWLRMMTRSSCRSTSSASLSSMTLPVSVLECPVPQHAFNVQSRHGPPRCCVGRSAMPDVQWISRPVWRCRMGDECAAAHASGECAAELCPALFRAEFRADFARFDLNKSPRRRDGI